MQRADVVIIGGGIVGLASAYQLTQGHPERSIIVLEKEAEVAQHQTGHNSGVLHSGIYYKPGSLKAVNCREGKKAMQAFCESQEIPYDVCGKVIVAVEDRELPTLQRIYQRGQENGVRCEIIDRDRLSELEPYAAGIKAIHVPDAGIVDFRQVCLRLAEIISAHDGRVVTGARVVEVDQRSDGVYLETEAGSFAADHVVNCTGLYSDRVTRWTGLDPNARIVPFRGEYFELDPSSRHLCRNLIYPVPDPSFPFLGVHFTRMIDGRVECGPNAVFAFAREGYRNRDINLRDMFESLTYPGVLRLFRKHWRMGMGEMWRSLNKRAFVRELKRLIPTIRGQQVRRAPAGVRAQAVARDGNMVDDFLICESARVVNVCNAPSPAATSSLKIGKTVVDRLAAHF